MENSDQFLYKKFETHLIHAKKDLFQEIEWISSCAARNYKKNSVANLHEKLIETEEIFCMGSQRLAEICTIRITEFEIDIQNVQDPCIKEISHKFRALLIDESQKLIKESISQRFSK